MGLLHQLRMPFVECCSVHYYSFVLWEKQTLYRIRGGKKKKLVCSQVIRTNVLKPRRRLLAGGPTDLVFLSRLNSHRIPVHSSVSIVQCGGFI